MDDNRVLKGLTLIGERMNTLQKDIDAHVNMDDTNISVDHGMDDDEDIGAINGQDDDDDDEDDDDDSQYTTGRGSESGSFNKAGGGGGGKHRSSNVMRYSMRLTEMRGKKKKN